MARDAVTITSAALHTATNTPAGTTINTTNGAYLTPSKVSRLLIRCTNTITNATKVVTIKAGDSPPALAQVIGDLALTVPQSGDIVFTIESARFMQSDGVINIDFGTGMTGAISAVSLPDSAS